MSWEIKYLPEAVKDLRSLGGSPRKLVRRAIEKVSKNPLPVSEGGLGKPPGNTK
ncbi:MAG: hypothetical protein LIO52_04230 [Oscillospiraceae bacterium]|nr:hypothetical protein [Oscillospiraceae bacterium]